MRICVDTVIFIDVLKDENREIQQKFYGAIQQKDSLIASVITVAELMPQFQGSRKDLHAFLHDHGIQVYDLDAESALIGSQRWMRYLKRKRARRCPACRARIAGRDSILADFLIGGFALLHSDRILTRDRGIFKTYFRDLKMMV